MKLTFKKEKIELSQGCEKIYNLKELNGEKIVEILELCIQYEETLVFEEEVDCSPISHKLCELIKNGLSQTKDNTSN